MTKSRCNRWARVRASLGIGLGLAASLIAVACSTDVTPGRCPEAQPVDRSLCHGQGTICEYPDDACDDGYFRAACSGDGTWHVDYFGNGCNPPPDAGAGGAAASGGAGGTAGSTAAGGGGGAAASGGGAGGAGGA